MASNRESLLDLAEQICREIAEEQRELTTDERHCFESLGWDRKDIQRQTGRLRKVNRFQEIAGTKSNFRKLETKLDQDRSELNPRIDQLMDQIHGHEKEIDQHRATLKQSETEIDRRREAIEGLRNLVPRHIRDQVDSEVRAVKASPIVRDLRQSESRLKMIETLVDQCSEVNRRTHDQIRNHTKAHRPDLIDVIVRQIKNSMGIEERINPDAWRQYLQSLQREIPDLQERIGLLRPQLDKALNEANQLLDFYWK